MKSLMVTGVVLAGMTTMMTRAEVKTEEVTYEGGGVEMEGMLVWDGTQEGKRPAVIVVHEWWGSNDYVRMRAKMLAEMGYFAMAVDMYGDGKTVDHPKDAGQFAGEVMKNVDVARERFEAAVELLQSRPEVDDQKIAAIGYCFGGSVVLHMARMGVDLDGVASFHGSLGAKVKAEPGQVKAKVLVCHGADDKFISQEIIDAFEAEMKAANVDYEFISYEGALHGFTNPDATANGEKFDIPLAYQEKADKASWAKLDGFLETVFK